ncbi:MAG TPA: hypothetical protein PLE35_10305, partial [Lentisphaeria bacterium]|nr:hypothetical protein [Lentisphaeria bacterium]
MDKTLVNLGDSAQRLEHPFCAPMASASKAKLRHLQLPLKGVIFDVGLPSWTPRMRGMNRAETWSTWTSV